MAELALFLLLYGSLAIAVYGVWRGRQTDMATGNGRFMLRGWHVAMWLAVSLWLTGLLIASWASLEPPAVAALVILPGAVLFLFGRRLHRR